MKIEFTKNRPIQEGQYLFCHDLTGEVRLVNLELQTAFEYSFNKEKLNPKNEKILKITELHRAVKNVNGFWSDKLEFKVPNSLFS